MSITLLLTKYYCTALGSEQLKNLSKFTESTSNIILVSSNNMFEALDFVLPK